MGGRFWIGAVRCGRSTATYGYDDYGRFEQVTDGPGLPAYGGKYAYVSDSDLLDKLDFMSGSSTTVARADYTHEANRDLVTVVENVVDPNGTPVTVSKYDYGQGDGYDALGRRTSVVNTGTAFGDAALSLWSYSDRSELTSAYRHEGDDPADPDDEITTQRRVYNYDHIGNRNDHTAGTAGPVYYCANDLNQYEHLDDQQDCPSLSQTGVKCCITQHWGIENWLKV